MHSSDLFRNLQCYMLKAKFLFILVSVTSSHHFCKSSSIIPS